MQTEKRLEEAEAIIKDCTKVMGNTVRKKSEDYMAKYHPQKDPLFEKWGELCDWFGKSKKPLSFYELTVFNKAKEFGLLTAGFDELVKYLIQLEIIAQGSLVCKEIQEIRTKYTND